MQNKLKERKYFDSGDYALSKAGKSDAGLVGGLGREHPSPDTIPHLSQQQSNGGSVSGPSGGGPALTPTVSHSGHAGSPQKESHLQRETSVDEQDADLTAKILAQADGKGNADEPAGVPIKQ